MFCRKCGKSLLDGDRFCSYCGAQVIERPDLTVRTSPSNEQLEEIVYNRAESEIITETVDIGAPEKSIAQTWGDINERSVDRNTRPRWNLEGFPNLSEEPRKTEDIRVDWEKRELLTFEMPQEKTAEQPTEAEITVEASIESPSEAVNRAEAEETASGGLTFAPAEEEKEQKPDIFEIFDRQLEEERQAEINDKDTLVFRRKPAESESNSTLELENDLFGKRREPISGSAEEQIDKFYTFSKKNEEFQKLLDKEYERLKSSSGFEPNVEKEPINMQNIQFANVVQEVSEVREEKEELSEPKKEETAGAEPESVEESVSVESTMTESIEAEAESTDTDTNTNTEAEKQETESQPQEAQAEEEQKEELLHAENVLENIEKIEEAEKPILEKAENKAAESGELPPNFPWDDMESPLEEFTDEEKKTSPVAVILGIIGVLLVIELALLGIKYFLPESNAAKFIDKNLGVAVNWVDALKGQEAEQQDITEEEKQDEAVQTNAEAVDPMPKADKTELINENIEYNVNITEISADDTLAFDESRDYGDELINNSKPIENNIWYEDESGNTVFYDSEIVRTLIMFDSSWIDYVNNSNEAVLGLLKEGSVAYENAKGFSKVGKITESFDSLKIGEIRQNGEVFLVWAKEVISKTEGQNTAAVEHQWIYQMEIVDSQFKIVKYTEF